MQTREVSADPFSLAENDKAWSVLPEVAETWTQLWGTETVQGVLMEEIFKVWVAPSAAKLRLWLETDR